MNNKQFEKLNVGDLVEHNILKELGFVIRKNKTWTEIKFGSECYNFDTFGMQHLTFLAKAQR